MPVKEKRIFTEEHRRKLSESHMGQKAWNKGLPQSEKHRKRNSEGHKGLPAWNKGIPATKETIEKLRKSHLGQISYMKGKKHSKETKEKISKTKSESYTSGKVKWTGRGNRGIFYSIKNRRSLSYRSSFELMAYQILEQMSKVKEYEVEPFAIPYISDGIIRHTVPDILVTYIDGKKEIIEVKPCYMLDDEKTIAKISALRNYCRDNNLICSIWTEEMLFSKKA